MVMDQLMVQSIGDNSAVGPKAASVKSIAFRS